MFRDAVGCLGLRDILWDLDGRCEGMAEDFSMWLRAARHVLGLNVKSVARALRLSDKTLTQVERFATEMKGNAGELVQFYEDLGLEFQRDANGDIVGVNSSPNIHRLVIKAEDSDPDGTIERLCRHMRHVGGMAYNLKLTNKGVAARFDTIDVHFPVSTRIMVRDRLERWFDEERQDGPKSKKGRLKLIRPDGKETVINKKNVKELI